jgi:hypothetical protein
VAAGRGAPGQGDLLLETKLTVPFYGHVRPYHNIQAEIDAKMPEVLESGQYVSRPMPKIRGFHGTR